MYIDIDHTLQIIYMYMDQIVGMDIH